MRSRLSKLLHMHAAHAFAAPALRGEAFVSAAAVASRALPPPSPPFASSSRQLILRAARCAPPSAPAQQLRALCPLRPAPSRPPRAAPSRARSSAAGAPLPRSDLRRGAFAEVSLRNDADVPNTLLAVVLTRSDGADRWYGLDKVLTWRLSAHSLPRRPELCIGGPVRLCCAAGCSERSPLLPPSLPRPADSTCSQLPTSLFCRLHRPAAPSWTGAP